jgi:hypothetical protein
VRRTSAPGTPGGPLRRPPAAAAGAFELRELDGIAIHAPRALRDDRSLTIAVASFLGVRRLVVEGWNPLGWELT